MQPISCLLYTSKEGADVNKKDIYGANVLFYVGYYDYEKRTSEENIKLLKYYIDKDTEINIKIDGVDNDGNLKKKMCIRDR